MLWLTGCYEQEAVEEDLNVIDNNGDINDENSDESIEKKLEQEQQKRKEVIEALSGLHEAKEDKGFYWPYYF